MALLGTKVHGAGNAIRYTVNYDGWLTDGQSLLSATVVLDPAFTATVTDIVISAVAVTPSHLLHFTVTGGSANEVFTLDVQTTTQNPTEIKKDTCAFTVQ